ncbi:MAG: transglutaminase domain-containing protein [Lachnospiraceae bacterium]|nr:transglutaminase domain-containing protein [Lachnospiraceae bacterium]
MDRHIKCKKIYSDSEPPDISLKNRLVAKGMGAAGGMLLIISGIIIGGELFESYKMPPLYIIALLCAAFLFSVLNSRAADLIIGFLAAAVIVYVIVARESGFASICANGSAQLINEYIQKWNYYFDTTYSFPQYGIEGAAVFCMAVTALAIIILHVASGICRRKIIFVLYPVLFIIGHLIVGLSPQLQGMMCMLAGVLLALHSDVESRRGKKYGLAGSCITAAMSVIIILLSCTVFGKPADAIVAAHDNVREFQRDIERSIKYWTKYGDTGSDGMVTNDTPEYNGQEVMKISVSSDAYQYNKVKPERPVSSMYLKGYHSSEYYYGKWIYDSNRYEDFCESVNMEDSACADTLFDMGNAAHFGDSVYENAEIEYTGIYGNKAYMPYWSYWRDDNEGLHVTEDYRFIKDSSVNKIKTKRYAVSKIFMYGIRYIEPYNTSYRKTFLDQSVGVAILSESPIGNNYSAFVERNYLAVPDNQKSARIIADEIKNKFPYKYTEDYSDGYSVSFEIETYGDNGTNHIITDDYSTNDYRNEMAYRVADYLADNAEYTLQPANNGDSDVIEYFLSESKRGFCVHFASAGVMILRSMGIPARYVTGYVAFPRDFKYSKDSGRYEASVKDYAAHAWVEVYLEQIGWVPYEMTPAYSADEDKLPTQWTSKDMEARYGGASIPETDGKNNSDNNNNNSAAHENDKKDAQSGLLSGTSGFCNTIMIAIIVLSAVIVTGIIAAVTINRVLKHRDLVPEGKVKGDADYNRAVKKINRTIYIYLIKKRGAKKYYRNDNEYYAALGSVFGYINGERWSAYAGIVRTAAYSDMNVSKEDAQLCMNILSDIRNIK